MTRATRITGAQAKPRRHDGGFTLLEMVIVLILLALMAALTIPTIRGAFVEQALRNDSHQLALMVKTAMIQAEEQRRPYVIELDSKSISLHPLGLVAKDATDPNAPDNIMGNAAAPDDAEAAMPDVSASVQFDSANKLQAPDTDKQDKWSDLPATTWTFQPGQLCPADRVRVSRGDSYVEMSFAALTGNVEDEKSYFP